MGRWSENVVAHNLMRDKVLGGVPDIARNQLSADSQKLIHELRQSMSTGKQSLQHQSAWSPNEEAAPPSKRECGRWESKRDAFVDSDDDFTWATETSTELLPAEES